VVTGVKEGPDLACIASLVRVRAASGVLFLDREGRVLLVHPTYKEAWEVPGGSLELDESPREAAEREIKEELGFAPSVGRLLCVDWVPPAPPWDGGLMFLFDGGVLSPEQVAGIRLRPEELDRFEFVMPAALDTILVPRLARRVAQCVRARDAGDSVYLEDGQAPL
jgi:8-oxo-dGTP pyrophosphatase MutT (NUDIX family)